LGKKSVEKESLEKQSLEKEILEIVSLKKESLKNDKLERDRERDWRFQLLTNIVFQALLIFILVMLERREAYQEPTTQIRRSLCRQMVP